MPTEDAVYEHRFNQHETAVKEGIWREVARHLQRYVRTDAVVMDLAADRGTFIRNIVAGEKWASDLRDTSALMGPDVRFVQSDGLALASAVPNSHFDVVFMSNYLEHLESSEAVIRQLQVVHKLLKPGGRAIVLQPNIALVGPRYWDFIDHRVPLTERSLDEAAELAGFHREVLIHRFLPYTVKSRMPTSPMLVRAYLAFRPAWWILGKQTLYVGVRRG